MWLISVESMPTQSPANFKYLAHITLGEEKDGSFLHIYIYIYVLGQSLL